jgi:hypothetical protein
MKTPKKLDTTYVEAKQSFVASVQDVDRLSKQRFEQLEKLPTSERIGHLTDPLLTPADALKLTRSLEANLVSGRVYRAPLRSKASAVIRWLRLRRILSPTILLILIIAAIYSGIAWRNTAHSITISRPIDVTWQYPSGPVQQRLETRFAQQLLNVEGERATIRLWVPAQGYVKIDVPSSIIVPRHGR